MMDMPIWDVYDQLHHELDKIEETWPLYQGRQFHWIHDFNQMVYEEWAHLESRLCRLQERLAELYLLRQYQKAKGYMTLGMYKEAEDCLNAIFAESPDAVPVRLFLAVVYYEKKQYQVAQNFLRPLAHTAKYPPVRNYVLLLLGCTLGQQGNWTEALDCFANVCRADPGSEEALYNQALCYYHLGEQEKMIHLLKNLLALKPDDAVLVQWLRHLNS